MKKYNLLFLMLAIGSLSFGQKNNQEEVLGIGVGGTFAKPKIIPALTKLAVAQVTVNYKLTTEERVIGKEKRSGSVAGAKVTAYLKTNDADLTEADLQEVTNYFYQYLQKKLKANGVDTVGWNTITGLEFYKDAEGRIEEGGERQGNVWVTTTANKGNIIYGGGIPFAFGKMKAASRFCKDLDAPAAFFHVTVDFADVLVNVDIKTSTSETMYTITKTKNTKFKSSVVPEVKAVPSSYLSLFWNEKMQSESLFVSQDISAGLPYSDNVSEDVSKARSGLAKQFAFRKEMTPVVIETTRDKYKAAAKKALEKYAEAFIDKINSSKK
jgi:hypothetical protein